MKNKTKKILYKCSIVFLIFVTIFTVTASCCFGASLTYPPDVVAVTIDKSDWAVPDTYVDGSDFFRPNFYLDEINYTSSASGYDEVAGGVFSPSQVSIGNPYYRFVPKLHLADNINTSLNYNGQLDFVNSSEQWEEGYFPIDFYGYDISYQYSVMRGDNSLIGHFDTGFTLNNSTNYASFEFSNIVLNGTSLDAYNELSCPTVLVGFFNYNLVPVTYSRVVTIEYEALSPVKVEGEWTYEREFKIKQYSDILDTNSEYEYTTNFNLFRDTQALYELRSSDVSVVRGDTVTLSKYIYIKDLIVEFKADVPDVSVARIYHSSEVLSQGNYFNNSLADYQEYIGDYTVLEIQYDYGLDFSDFISSVTSIFNIELFAGFTLLDILTGVIGVFVLVWFLKVFAGG